MRKTTLKTIVDIYSKTYHMILQKQLGFVWDTEQNVTTVFAKTHQQFDF